ncbi:Rgg/GadR/MutR family transcriptional regulator [Lactobacillus crispatus]|uniref:helix-turn-helix domain-containing protein n=1 Tax=Lactobacillus crispatus TaxID=47770 RepID=UPI0030F6A88D
MKIGEALKLERKQLNLSQSKMAGNILTKSFYSKVERDICSIRANDLLQILSLHNIDYSSFFKKVENNTNKHHISKIDCDNLLHTAYYQKDLSKITELEKMLNDRNNSELNLDNIRAQIIIIKAAISNTLAQISNDEKQYIKKTIFETDNWTENSLRLFAISMSIFDPNEINSVVKNIIKNTHNINSLPEEKQKIISAILVNYLSYFIKKKQRIINTNIDASVKILNSLTIDPKNCFAKIMANYYESILNNKLEKAKTISNFLRENGMDIIADKL